MKKLLVLLIFFGLYGCASETETVNNIKNVEDVNVETEVNDKQGKDATEDEEYKKALSLYESGDKQGAIEIYEKIMKDGNITIDMINKLFTVYVDTINFEKALNIIYMMVSNFGAEEELVGSQIEKDDISKNIVRNQDLLSKSELQDPDLLLEQAKLFYLAGDYYYETDKSKYFYAIMLHYLSAYLMLEDALEFNPDNSELYFYQGRLLMDIGNSFELAQIKLEKAIELKQDDFRYYYRLGNAYMHQDKHTLAKETFLKGIALNDKYEKLHLNLGNMYFKLGEKEKGYTSYDNGLEVCSEMCDAFHYNTGNELFNEGKKQEAKKAYERALEINPKKQEAIDMLKKIK